MKNKIERRCHDASSKSPNSARGFAKVRTRSLAYRPSAGCPHFMAASGKEPDCKRPEAASAEARSRKSALGRKRTLAESLITVLFGRARSPGQHPQWARSCHFAPRSVHRVTASNLTISTKVAIGRTGGFHAAGRTVDFDATTKTVDFAVPARTVEFDVAAEPSTLTYA